MFPNILWLDSEHIFVVKYWSDWIRKSYHIWGTDLTGSGQCISSMIKLSDWIWKMYLFRPDEVSSNNLLPIYLTSKEEKNYLKVKNNQIFIISPSKDYMKLKNNLISIIPPSKFVPPQTGSMFHSLYFNKVCSNL